MSLRARLRRSSRAEQPTGVVDNPASKQRPERDPKTVAAADRKARQAELDRKWAAEYAAAIADWREWDREPAWQHLDRFNPCP